MRILLVVLIILSGCETNPTETPPPEPDAEPPRLVLPPEPDAEPDAELDSQAVPVIWDASVPVDAQEVDVAICNFGETQDCQLPEHVLGVCAQGTQYCFNEGWTVCQRVINPRSEQCNGLDDDCDGTTDESQNPAINPTLFQPCYTGPLATQKVGPCHGGFQACEQLEDGSFGYSECQEQWTPRPEICDGYDNDCNGHSDDLPELGTPCTTLNELNETGLCHPGQLTCVPGNFEPVCINEITPARELCDGLDNDCDDTIDENAGSCECGDPLFVPRPEVCNGVDDDCDGLVDNEPQVNARLSTLCFTPPDGILVSIEHAEDFPPMQPPCGGGRALCEQDINGEYGYFECLGEVRAQQERCDGLDNDCDGNTDEGFEQGTAVVVFGVDISGSMQDDEIATAVRVANNALQRLAANVNICYIVTIIGAANDPIMLPPALGCVPAGGNLGANAQAALSRIANENFRDRGNEGTLDLLMDVATDDRDIDGDGILEEIDWHTNIDNPNELQQVDLRNVDHRIVILIGDEEAQSNRHLTTQDVAPHVHAAGVIVYVIAPLNSFRQDLPNILPTYAPLLPQNPDGSGCVQSPGNDWCDYFYPINRRGDQAQQEQAIIDSVEAVMSELDCYAEDAQ
jgi:hypothetical protein